MKWLTALLLALILVLPGCSRQERQSGKLQVVTTLFPLYDFARTIGGEKAQVTLLLPPGIEPHSFEPRPEDVVRVNRADLFIYTNAVMEPWAASIISGLDKGKVAVVEGGKGIVLVQGPVSDQHRGGHGDVHEGKGGDPHIWLDFDNARAIARNILAAYVTRDPANKAYYESNAAGLDRQLAELDQRFRESLAKCPKKVLLHGGHYAFGYMAKRYGLKYVSASAVNADAEPTPTKLAELVQIMRREHLGYVYTEELLSPRVAETIARETGAKVLMLRAGHNVTKDDLQRGVTFISLMEENLNNLKTGLQ